MASWTPPQGGSPLAMTSILRSSCRWMLSMFKSMSRVLVVTRAHASRQTLAAAFSSRTPRDRNTPAWAQAERWSPKGSRMRRHRQRRADRGNARRRRLKSRIRKICGWYVVSSVFLFSRDGTSRAVLYISSVDVVSFFFFSRAFLTAERSVARTVVLVSLQALGTMLAIYIPAAPGCAEERAKSFRSACARNGPPAGLHTGSTTQLNSTQLNSTQRNATQRNATQRNATQLHPTQLNSTQLNSTQVNPTQPNSAQRNATQRNATQLNSIQLNSTQLNSTQLNSTQLNSTQLNSSQLNLTQPNPTQPNPTQLNSTQLNSTQLNSTQLNSTVSDGALDWRRGGHEATNRFQHVAKNKGRKINIRFSSNCSGQL